MDRTIRRRSSARGFSFTHPMGSCVTAKDPGSAADAQVQKEEGRRALTERDIDTGRRSKFDSTE
jgi:hypothetical protein